MHELAAALVRLGIETTVILPAREGLIASPRDGVQLVPYQFIGSSKGTWGYGSSLTGAQQLSLGAIAAAPFATTGMVRAARRVVRNLQPDILHLHWVLPQGVVSYFLRGSLPIVVSAHGADVALIARSRLLKLVARGVLTRSRGLVAANSGILQRLPLGEGNTPLTRTVPHGADSSLFSIGNQRAARQRLGLPQTGTIILAVGRLVRKKGFHDLIAAAPTLDPEAHVYILGEGPQQLWLQQLASDTDPDRIHLMGAVGRSVLPDWYRSADVVTIPSISTSGDLDSGPVVLMEALASGRPVVATPVGMAPDVIVDGINGYLVSESSPRELAAALNRASLNSVQLSRGALSTFQRLGDWDRVALDLAAVYEAVIDGE